MPWFTVYCRRCGKPAAELLEDAELETRPEEPLEATCARWRAGVEKKIDLSHRCQGCKEQVLNDDAALKDLRVDGPWWWVYLMGNAVVCCQVQWDPFGPPPDFFLVRRLSRVLEGKKNDGSLTMDQVPWLPVAAGICWKKPFVQRSQLFIWDPVVDAEEEKKYTDRWSKMEGEGAMKRVDPKLIAPVGAAALMDPIMQKMTRRQR